MLVLTFNCLSTRFSSVQCPQFFDFFLHDSTLFSFRACTSKRLWALYILLTWKVFVHSISFIASIMLSRTCCFSELTSDVRCLIYLSAVAFLTKYLFSKRYGHQLTPFRKWKHFLKKFTASTYFVNVAEIIVFSRGLHSS